MSVNLGDRVRDKITGFQGIVIGVTDWLYQCRRPIVQPEELKDGKMIDSQSFDEDQLEVLAEGVVTPKFPHQTSEATPSFDVIAEKRLSAPVPTGGPQDVPSRGITPTR